MEKEKINENYEVLDESNGDSSSDELDYYVKDCSFVERVGQYFANLWDDFDEAQFDSGLNIWDGDRFIGYSLTIVCTMFSIALTLFLGLVYCTVNFIYVDEVITYFSNHPIAFNIIKACAFSPMIGIGADIALTVCRFFGYRLHRFSDWIDYFIKNNFDIKLEEDLVKDESREEELKQEIKNEVVQEKNEVLQQDVNPYEKRVQDVLLELDSDMGLENNSNHVHTYVNNRFNELYNRICSLSDSAHKNFCLVSLKNAILSYKEEEKKGTSNINDLNATFNYIMSCSNGYSENSDQRKLIK